MPIFDSFIAALKKAPGDRSITVLMRHSVRYPILSCADTYTAGLTPEGVRIAEDLGAKIDPTWQPSRLGAPPVARCLDTAQAIARGAGWQKSAQTENRISFPFLEKVFDNRFSYKRCNPFPPEISDMIAALNEGLDEHSPKTLNLFVTHDTVIETALWYLFNVHLGMRPPEYLESLLLWHDNGSLRGLWRGEVL